MLIILTGSGKGKSTAAIGQAIRAVGRDMRVAFGQFMKLPDQAGEQRILANLLAENFYAAGPGFLTSIEEREEHRKAVIDLLSWAKSKLASGLDMLILDETLYVLQAKLLLPAELASLIEDAAKSETHLLLTGRGLPAWLLEKADLVTEMTPLKHPYNNGVPAGPGIEF